ncbi:MAG: hypothetical protein GY932_12435, partial [Arcobacter sp.]|nr:hypothetical protein [Arcobacter sp.]
NEDGETMEISLKAVSIESKQIIEEALAKYPDMPIMTTDEMAKLYEDNPMVFGSGFANEELRNITEERFEELINKIQPIDSKSVVYNGVAISTAALLYPFTISYIRKKISYKQLTIVFEKVLKKQGLVLASRLSYSIVLGPIFAWYLLARGVKAIVSSTEPEINEKKYFVEYKNN